MTTTLRTDNDLPTWRNVKRRTSDGEVTLDAQHGHTGLAGVIGTALPIAGGTGWIWIPAGSPSEARTAGSEVEALDELLADVLTEVTHIPVRGRAA